MNIARLVRFVSLAAVLSVTVVGCRKNVQRPTSIPGQGARPITTAPAPLRNPENVQPFIPPSQPVVTGVDPFPPGATGIEPVSGDRHHNWIENREEFRNQTVYFDFDKSNVRVGEVSKLEEVARRMKSRFNDKALHALRIEGHCDERGTEEYNRALGDRRALSIREKLVQLGLDPEMLPTISYGEDRPSDTGHSEEAWRKNRRGELILLSPP